MSNSIRTRLSWAIESLKDLNDEELTDKESINAKDTKHLIHVIGAARVMAERLLTEVDRVDNLLSEWDSLIQNDRSEAIIKENFIKDIGDIDNLRNDAFKTIEELRKLYVHARSALSTVEPLQVAHIETWDNFISSVKNQHQKQVKQEPFHPMESQSIPTSNHQNTTTSIPVHSSIPTHTNHQNANTPSIPANYSSTVYSNTVPSNGYSSNMLPNQSMPYPSNLSTQYPTNNGNQFSSNQYVPSINSGITRVGLPMLSLPQFAGDITTFLEFTESFDSLMNLMQCDDLARFHYLKGQLRGDALDLIKGIPVLSQNYRIARSMLTDSYGGTLRLKQNLIQQLDDLPDIHKSHSPKDLHSFFISASKVFQQLNSFNCEMDNIMTASRISSKLPKRVISKLYSTANDNPLTAGELLTRLQKIVQTENLIDDIFTNNHRNEFDQSRNVTTMAAFHNQKSGSKFRPSQEVHLSGRPHKLCDFCASPRMTHRPQDCRQYKTRKERKQRASDLKLCFRCLEVGHSAKFCKTHCRMCKGGHHESLCPNDGHNRTTSFHQMNSTFPQMNFSPTRTNHGAPYQQPGWNNQRPPRPHQYQHQQQQQPPRTPNQQPTNHMQQQYQSPPHQQRTHGQNANGFNQRGGGVHQPNYQQPRPVMTTQLIEDDNVQQSSQDARVQMAEIYHVDQIPIQDAPKLDEFVNTKDADHQIVEDKAVSKEDVIMMTATIPVIDNNGKVKMAAAFFDTGSTTSFISRNFTEDLFYETLSERKIKLNVFGSKDSTDMDSRLIKSILSVNDNRHNVKLFEVGHIAHKVVAAPISEELMKSFMEGHHGVLPKVRRQPDLLIGLDIMWDILGPFTTIRLDNGLHLHQTNCGPILSGREAVLEEYQPLEDMEEITSCMVRLEKEENLSSEAEQSKLAVVDATNDILKSFWSMEHYGIIDNPKTKDEEETSKFFHETLSRDKDGRYIVRLPFRDLKDIPTNRALAYYRLLGTLRKLSQQKEMKDQYNKIFEEQLELGFIELVADENSTDGMIVHYLAHHPIVKESSKSTKVRIVFDGSARHRKDGKSLNDALHAGESLLPEIAGLMLRNRKPKILMSADITKAFLQLDLHLEDRDATRFLWISQDNKIICYRYKRLPFGLKPSPYLLNATIKHHLQQYDSQFARDMERSMFVDNVFVGVKTSKEAEEFYHYSKLIFEDAKMNLCQYVSNDKDVNAFFEKMEQSSESNDQKLLGLKWNTDRDVFVLSLPQHTGGILTKRIALKIIASCYDILGFLSPTVLLGKLFFRKLDGSKLDWDTPLTEEQHNEWNAVMDAWKGDSWEYDRRYFNHQNLETAKLIELHVFTDASKLAFGAVAYIRLITHQQEALSSFVMSKSRIAPLRPEHSIPQLEMLGILTGVKLANYILKEIDIDFGKVYLWTDSMCALDLITSTNGSNNRFMRNRINQVKEKSENFIFSHIPGELNPADYVSRGLTFNELKDNSSWKFGPKFLQSMAPLPIRQSSQEERAVVLAAKVQPQEEGDLQPVIDPKQFSKFHRMLRTVMVILHFLTRRKFDLQHHIGRARLLIYMTAQLLNPPSEDCIQSLQLTKNDNGLWMYTGRVERKPLIYLPHGRIALLLVLNIHIRHAHSSPLYTLARLRETFWIPRGKSFINKCLKRCGNCKTRKSKPYKQPPFASLPACRYSISRPFENVGTDYAGPFNVTVNDKVISCWFIIFTCLYSRYTVAYAVTDMEANTFLHRLRRLSAKFGIPKIIICDNGTQFAMLQKVIDIIENQCSQHQISSVNLPKIRHIPAHSPWAGGVYERVIGIIKECLRKIGLTRQLVSLQDFQTTLEECISIINMRPISYITEDDNIKPLCPNDFVFPDSNLNHQLDIEPLNLDQIPKNRATLIENWSRSSSLTDAFRRRWIKEYPQIFQSRHEFLHKQKHATEKKPQVGDIVLIEQKEADKNKWTMAKIQEVKSRSAIILNGRTKRTGEYPYCKLFPIETDMADEVSTENTIDNPVQQENENQDEPSPSNSRMPGPRRSTRIKSMVTPILLSLAVLFPSCTCSTTEYGHQLETTTSSSNIFWNIAQDTAQWMTMVHMFVNAWILLSLIYTTLVILACGGQILTSTIGITTLLFTSLFKLVKIVWRSICGRRKLNRKIVTVIFMLIFLKVQWVQGCSDVASIQATDHVCVEHHNGTQTCTINKVNILNVRPNGSLACFKVAGGNNVIQSLEIKVTGITSICQQHTHFYAREYDLNYEYAHRCAGVGPCKNAKCSKTGPQDQIEDLSQAARDAPGYTQCFEGCGCITCDLCIRCDSSCVFNRIYAKPASEDIYEVFTCPSWTTVVDIEVAIDGAVWSQEVHHGIPVTIPNTNISVTITGFSTPPSPMNGATFISKTTKDNGFDIGYTFTTVAVSGNPSKGLIGEFQCATKKKAETFDCHFDQNLCTCAGQGYYTECICKRISLQSIVAKTSLPQIETGILVHQKEGVLRTTTTSTALVSLHVNFQNQTVTRSTKDDTCVAVVQEVSGCFACREGFVGKIECTKNISGPASVATITCPSFVSYINCDSNGIINTVNMYSSFKDVYFNCTVNCGNARTMIEINGTLDDEEKFELEEPDTGRRHSRNFFESPLETIASGVNWLKDKLYLAIGQMVFKVAVLAAALLLALRFCRPLRGVSRRISRRNRFSIRN